MSHVKRELLFFSENEFYFWDKENNKRKTLSTIDLIIVTHKSEPKVFKINARITETCLRAEDCVKYFSETIDNIKKFSSHQTLKRKLLDTLSTTLRPTNSTNHHSMNAVKEQ